MGIANFPFPSFTLLLTSDRVVIPGPSYVIKFAPLSDSNVNDNLIEECYPLANLDFEDDSATLGHCDSEEFADDVVEIISMSSGSVQKTIARSGQGVGIKFRLPFLKRPTARFQLKSIFKRLSQFKIKR